MPQSEHDVLTTQSRRSQPRQWLTVVTWLVKHRAHPKALATTTVNVAADLAARMDFQRGIVLYDLEGTAHRLGISRATVKRHIKVLRELGTLVWLQHGSRRNLRLPGRAYTATATVYGATIPPVYDQAHGHRLSGRGYTARHIGFTPEGRRQAILAARESATRTRREPPSRTPITHDPEADLRHRSTTTRPARRATLRKPRTSILGATVTAAAYQAADRLARALRPLHTWLQHSRTDQLSWALIDKAADRIPLRQVDQWLHEINPVHHFGPDWRPTRPHVYLAAQLLRDAAVAGESDLRTDTAPEPVGTSPTPEFHDAVDAMRNDAGPLKEFAEITGIDDLDASLVRQMRADAWRSFKQHGNTDLVLVVVDGLGVTEAGRLYTPQLVDACLRVSAQTQPAA
ncbi:hypothetical protein [Streptomyces niveus]|uniref:hypothetical protein n=1 Tax=Streptomyces niveus TaxID=193462 RepID=UPI0034318184